MRYRGYLSLCQENECRMRRSNQPLSLRWPVNGLPPRMKELGVPQVAQALLVRAEVRR